MLQSIRSKLIFASCVSLFSLCALTGFNLWSLSYVNNLMILSESFGDLTNSILEVRRYEKNVFLYHDIESLNEVTAYLERTNKLVEQLSDDIIRIAGIDQFKDFRTNLTGYHATMRQLMANGNHQMSITDQEEVRTQGKAMVEFANRLVNLKRTKIHRTIYRISMLPFAFLGIFVLLMTLAITLYSKRLLRPLRILQKKTREVGSGNFTPITFKDNYDDEISGLVRAFNRMATELENNQESLVQARKMAAMGTFTAGIAHELNNPINNISLTAEAFMEEYSETLDEEAGEMLQDIIAQVERANDIVRNLLDFSRNQEISFTTLHVGDVIDSTLKLIKNQIRLSGIKLDVQVARNMPMIKGNARGLQQVFMNILINAQNAMSDGGNIRIRAFPGTIEYVRVDISDTGHGITPEAREHIFEPFFTTKGVGKGVGLGLSVSYSIVNNHGGYIKLDSEVGKGTTFSIFLPFIKEGQS